MSDFVPLYTAGGFARDVRFSAQTAAALPPPPPEDEAAAADPVLQAWEDGHAAGYAAAFTEAEATAAEAEAARTRFALSLERLDAELAEGLRQKLHATVVALCEETLRPLALDPAALARRVERAVAMFARADDERVIRLNPADHALVAGQLPVDWTFVPDPALEPGALRVETQSGGVEDGPEQWRRDITEALRLC